MGYVGGIGGSPPLRCGVVHEALGVFCEGVPPEVRMPMRTDMEEFCGEPPYTGGLVGCDWLVMPRW